MAKSRLKTAPAPSEPLRLDLGCGARKADGFTGVDLIQLPGVDQIVDLKKTWPWKDESVSEVHSSHTIEHFKGTERIHFFNELYRVLKVGSVARIIAPNWSHERAYGDPTHEWPPVSTWTFFYLNKAWRVFNAPHVDYESTGKAGGFKCDFDHTIVGIHDPNDTYVNMRNMETKIILMSRSVNTTADIIATLTKKAS